MKIKTVLLTVLMTLIIAIGAFAETTYFTCESDPEDFNGKVFDNLYVFIEGCDNFDSTVISGKDSFLTLKDIRVNGMLFFADDHYDPATEVYTDADLSDKTKHADTYLNIAGDSNINKMYAQCVYNHDCNFGLQYPSVVWYLGLQPLNKMADGKIVIRGKIDPFVDEFTDYYHDTFIKAYPNFNLETFDLDLVKAAAADYDNFNMANIAAVIDQQNHIYPYGLRATLKHAEFGRDLAEVFRRGHVKYAELLNNFVVQLGDVRIDLANIAIGEIDEWNFGKNEAGETVDVTDMWTVNLFSRGFTTIGVMGMDSSFTTDIYAPAPYSVKSTDQEKQPLPLYVDMMVLGGVGKTLKYDMNYTQISMLNYLGNEDPNSKLDLNMGNVGASAINQPAIGIANIIGGKFDMSAKDMVTTSPSIDKLKFYEGIDSYKVINNISDVNNINDTLFTYYIDDDKEFNEVYLYNIDDNGNDDAATRTLRDRRWDLYKNNILAVTDNVARSVDGYFFITRTLDKMIRPGNTNMAGKSVVSFSGQNLSLGDVAVSTNLGPITSWMSSSCHFLQHGVPTLQVSTIR